MGAVGIRCPATAGGSGEHHPSVPGRLAENEIGEEGGLLDRVETMGDDDAGEPVVGQCRAGAAGQGEHGGDRGVPAGFGEDVLDDDLGRDRAAGEVAEQGGAPGEP